MSPAVNDACKIEVENSNGFYKQMKLLTAR